MRTYRNHGGDADDHAVQQRQSPGKRTVTESFAPSVPDGSGSEGGIAAVASRVGVDASSVQFHQGDGVAESLGARAVTRGDNVHFAGGELAKSDAPFLIGHELAHVVQQRQGSQAIQAKDSGGNQRGALEAEADRVGLAVARGDSAAGTIIGAAVPGSVQKFESGEHMELGDEATKGEHGEAKTVELAADYRITYGEMVAMGGDFFGGISEMRALAGNPGKGAGSREEIEYVRVVKVHGQDKREGEFSEAARLAADKRYYKLAASNPSHFVNPESGDASKSIADKTKHGDWDAFKGRFKGMSDNAVAHYHMNHLIAIREAMDAGKAGRGIDGALASNAFGDHYLTDSFSAGHNRTPRTSATAYWNGKTPMFFYNFKGFLAQKLAFYIDDHKWGGVVTTQIIWEKSKAAVDDALAKKGMPDFTLGDLVSGAIHDYDNTKGISVKVDGADKKIFGDGKLHQGDTKDVAMTAVRASVADIEAAHEVGAAGGDYSALYARIAADGMFRAEKMIPVATPDAALPEAERSVKWDHASAFELLGDPKFREGLKIFLAEKKSELAKVGETLDEEYKREAFRNAILAHMGGDEGIQMIWEVINWTPNTGGGVGGHDQDDNAMDYFAQAQKTSGGLASLTWTQRANLIRDLVDGATMGDEETAIFELLSAGSDSDAHQVIDWVGWDTLEDEVGDRFSKRYPRSSYHK